MESRYRCPVCGESRKIRGKKHHKKWYCKSCGIVVRDDSARKLIGKIHELYDGVRVEKMKDSLMYAALKSIGNKKEYKVKYDTQASSFGVYYIRAYSSKYVLRYTLRISGNRNAVLRGRKDHDVSDALKDLLRFVFYWNSIEKTGAGRREKNKAKDTTTNNTNLHESEGEEMKDER